jgi:hypothetical protein
MLAKVTMTDIKYVSYSHYGKRLPKNITVSVTLPWTATVLDIVDKAIIAAENKIGFEIEFAKHKKIIIPMSYA